MGSPDTRGGMIFPPKTDCREQKGRFEEKPCTAGEWWFNIRPSSQRRLVHGLKRTEGGSANVAV